MASLSMLLLSISYIDILNTRDNNFVNLYITTLVKNELLVNLVKIFVQKHPDIHNNNRIHAKEKYKFEFQINLIINSFIEVFYGLTIFNLHFSNDYSNIDIIDCIIWFIPLSFFFEIIFDFFHYWTHRMIHEYPLLYKYIHKKHHLHNNPNVYTSFYQDPLDLLITNFVPTLLTFYIVNSYTNISYDIWRIINTYKVYIEICGHSGKDIKKTVKKH